jgi:hypothetical protein
VNALHDNSIEITAEVMAAVQSEVPDATIRVVGGIVTAALISGVEYDVANRAVIVPEGASLPTRRSNGTRRDLDFMVLNTDPELGERVYHSAVRASDTRLNVSMFQAVSATAPSIFSRKGEHVIDEQIGSQFHRIGPFRAKVPDSATDEWKVVLPSCDTFPILHPRFHATQYQIRRLRGLHPKDLADGKLEALHQAVKGMEGAYSDDQNAAYAELDGLAITIQELQDMSFFEAVGKYGRSVARAKIGQRIAYSGLVVNYFQRREDQKYAAELVAHNSEQFGK